MADSVVRDEMRVARWTRWDYLAAAAVTLVAGVFRFLHLGDPDQLVFDETYYAKDACWYVNTSESICDIGYEQTDVHPPLGKWLIALGIRIFDYDSTGYRVAAAAAGTITVLLVYLLARELLKSTLGATLAAGLLALDFLHFVQSRVAMLDIFLTMFGVAAVLFIVYDRRALLVEIDADGERGPPLEHGLFARPWRIAAGAAAGAAIASKWSGGFFLVIVILLAVVWEVAARRSAGAENSIARALKEEWPSFVLWLVLLPLAVYCLTFIGRVEGALLEAPWAEGSWGRSLWDRHVHMWNFHEGLSATHRYQSPAWSWMLLRRPVAYFFCGGERCDPPIPEGEVQEIFASGNPFVWWASILALVYVAVVWIRTRDFQGPEGVILAGLINYLPWLLPFIGRDAMFIFYLLPTVPFMCVALAYVAVRIGRSWEARAAQAIFATATIGLFIFYFPLLTKETITNDAWNQRIWKFDDCDAPEGDTVTNTITETTDGTVTTSLQTTNENDDLPPDGWCWI